MKESTFGNREIPILDPPEPPGLGVIKEDVSTEFFLRLTRGLIITVVFSVFVFLIYQCAQVSKRSQDIKYRKVAAQHNLPVLDDRPEILAVYKIYSDKTGEIEIQAKKVYSKVQADGKLLLEFYNDECGCSPFATYTGMDSLIKIKDGYPWECGE